MKLKYLLPLTMLLYYGKLISQSSSPETPCDIQEFPESIVTDRPDQTESPLLTPHKWFQIEIGAQSEFDKDKELNVQAQGTLYNTTLWKYGLSKRFELRLITEYANDKLTDLNQKKELHSESGLNPITIGAKTAICQAQGWRPQISLITHLSLPYFGADAFKPSSIVPRYRFLFSHPINDRFNFSYNIGMEWEDGSSVSTTIYTASLGITLHERLGMFIETYGFYRENSTGDNRADGGFTFLINNNNQLDVSAGIGLNDFAPDYFISCGYSFRFNAFDRKKS